MIKAGRVTINGETATLGARVDPAHDVVAVDGHSIARSTTQRTLMLNKPAGYVTTRHDPHAVNTVMSLLPPIPGLHPIGRLDKNTTGLLLFTTDGDLTFTLTHPRHAVDKTYRAWVDGVPSNATLEQLRKGVLLEDGLTAPARVRRLITHGERTQVEVIIHEGRKRQVRRMLEALGHRVRALTRTRLGPLSLGELPEGKWRDLTEEEVRALRASSQE